ncbi:LysE family translocator [Aureimonas fodinaquatilis]|uniref:LysE family translocator n=1 Tax=Aureimonas fodinaquatilis TaxID=2565783 RepID=A0A5B0E1R7_9HYPH|nr:LysE family translocator [Aureimonas fodinaquatilis]KAA0971680.1 LysE family translocator [Aureimonas fodinaquatilis]
MTIAAFLAYCLALGIAAAIPGPGIIALVGRALGSDFRSSLTFLVGLALGDVFYLMAACFGLSLLAEVLGDVFTVIRYGAAAYLLYLAIRLWRASGDKLVVAESVREKPLASMLSGFAVTLANPKTIFFYLALLPTLIDLRAIDGMDISVLAVVSFAIVYIALLPYAALAARARYFLRTPRALKRMNRGAAAILAGAALWTASRGT